MKRGYSRISQMVAFHARSGRMNPEDASEYYQIEGKKPPSLQIFLEYIGMTEEEFTDFVRHTEVSPYSHDYSRNDVADETWDFDTWYREDNRLR